MNQADELLNRVKGLLMNCSVDSGVCGCGDAMEDHSVYCGHSPVDYGQYVADKLLEDIRKYLENPPRSE